MFTLFFFGIGNNLLDMQMKIVYYVNYSLCERMRICRKEEQGMENDRENVLKSWMKLSLAINNERVVSGLPYNEFLICGILYRNQKSLSPRELTATDLCSVTKILKSQMNRTLNSLEKKGLIARTRSQKDKRQIYVTFRMEQAKVYEQEHERILKFVDELMNRIGWERSEEIVKLFDLIANMADEVIG